MTHEYDPTSSEVRGDSSRSTSPAVFTRPRRPVKLWYMASPITTPSDQLQHRRGKAAARVAGYLLMKDMPLFCPATHSIAIEEEWPRSASYNWYELDEKFLGMCDGLILLKLPGWEDSKGVKAEYEYAVEHGYKVLMYDPRHLFTKQEWVDLQPYPEPLPDTMFVDEGNLLDDNGSHSH